jgi:hypothetical protein
VVIDNEADRERDLEAFAEMRAAQRERALAMANETRQRGKKVREALRQRRLDPFALIAGTTTDVVGDPELANAVEETVANWTLEKVLGNTPGVGPVRRHEILSVFRASPRMRLGALTYARRAELAKLVRAARDPSVTRI